MTARGVGRIPHGIVLAVLLAAVPMVFGQVLPGAEVSPPNDRLQVYEKGAIEVSVAVPSAEETREIFAVDLYERNIQPIWVQVRNLGDEPRFLTPVGMDPAYYSAREAMARLGEDRVRSKRDHLQTSAISRLEIPANSIRSGYVFTPVDEGTKSFNVDILGGNEHNRMSFFVPVPGLRLDHYEVDLEGLYAESERRELDLPQLVAELERLPCCVRDAKGEDRGDPLNLVLIGEVRDLYYAFMRAGWDETETIYGASLFKTAMSAVAGDRYRYSPVSALYVFGRSQDVALQRARSSIHERNHLRLWLTPLVHEGKPVWTGQISRDIGVRFTTRTITTHKIDPDVDETREFLLEDLAYAQSLAKFGYVGGVGAAPYAAPRANLTGDPYFTDGRRVVMWLSGSPTALDAISLTDLSAYATGHVSD